MIKLPSGVDINNLIDDIRIISWKAADILLYYSRMLENSDDKINILQNNNEKDPVTLADLEVNEIIIKGIKEKYKRNSLNIMTELEELEDIVGSLESIEPFGIEPDFSSLGLEPAEVLGFQTEEELENAIKLLTMEVNAFNFLLFDN